MVRSAPKSTGGFSRLTASVTISRSLPMEDMRWSYRTAKLTRQLRYRQRSQSHLTLYPGNVAVIEPEVKQMVTVSGRIRAEDGTLLANARINNHIGRTRTDENGEFVMDVDKKYPTIDFRYSGNKTCEVALELNQARGAVWVGDVVCSGLSSWAAVTQTGEENES